MMLRGHDALLSTSAVCFFQCGFFLCLVPENRDYGALGFRAVECLRLLVHGLAFSIIKGVNSRYQWPKVLCDTVLYQCQSEPTVDQSTSTG